MRMTPLKLQNMETRWGLPSYDRHYNGLPINEFNLLETDESTTGLIGIAYFIAAGLRVGEPVALISFAAPEQILAKLKKLSFDLSEHVNNEQLFIFSYQDTFTRTLNIATDYQALFNEINLMARTTVQRTAFLNADLLLNLQSHQLTTLSASRLIQATRESEQTILAHYTFNDTPAHRHLQAVGRSLLSCYITIRRRKNQRLALKVKKEH